MPRVKRGVITKKKHKALRLRAKGRRLLNRTSIKRARQADIKSGVQSYRDRRNKKRTFRRLWTVKISAVLKESGSNYSTFIKNLKSKNIDLDRKILASLAKEEPASFQKILEFIK